MPHPKVAVLFNIPFYSMEIVYGTYACGYASDEINQCPAAC
jgi:hypothetical protein